MRKAVFVLVGCVSMLIGGVWATPSNAQSPKAVKAVAANHGAGAAASSGRLKLGYWEVQADAEVFGWGDAVNYTPQPPLNPVAPVVGASRTPDGGGYWLVASDGGIFSFGHAHFYGSTGNIRLNQPVVGMAATPSGHGYWFVASDGGIFSFGDAHFYGSTGNIRLNRPVVGMAATPSGHGYWLVASDGGIFSFGDAHFYGSTGNIRLNQPVVGMAATPSGHGYWFAASDGGIFSFGDARFHGSTGNVALVRPVVGMAATPSGAGYWLVASDGGVFTFGDAEFDGSLGGLASYPAPTVALVSQSPPLGSIAAHSRFAGVWGAHGAFMSVADDGRFAIDYRTYNWCNLPGTPRGPGPCDYLVSNLIIDGGAVGGRITSTSGDTAATLITWDPAGGRVGHTATMAFDPAHDTVTFLGFTFCGPTSPVSFCGA